MGYDMYWLGFRHKAGDDGYFRLNISGGTRYALALMDLGAAYDGGYQVPEWPRYPDGYEEWREQESTRDLFWIDAAQLHRFHQYEVERHAHLRWAPPEGVGIPVHKIAGSNDGWVVTATECRAALGVLDEAGLERVDEMLTRRSIQRNYWDRWITFIRGAIEHGGFEVH